MRFAPGSGLVFEPTAVYARELSRTYSPLGGPIRGGEKQLGAHNPIEEKSSDLDSLCDVSAGGLDELFQRRQYSKSHQHLLLLDHIDLCKG